MGRRCVVPSCPFKYLPPEEGCMHSFPTDPTLQMIWRIKCGAANLQFNQTTNGLCSAHFSSDNYKFDASSKKRMLRSYALPDENLPEMNPTDAQFDVNSVTGLLQNLKEYEIQESKLLQELSETKTKLKSAIKSKDDDYVRKTEELFGHIFTKSQLDMIISKKRYKRWEDEDIAKAIGIHNISSQCYEYLRDQLHFPLPSKRTVSRKSAKITIQPGLIKPVLAVLAEESKNFTHLERQAVLCFDEVSIDSRVALDEKYQKILGPYKNMMAVSVRGLFSSWKQLVYFGFDVRLTKDKIHEIISALFGVGINVVAMVSDMSTINVRVWKELGIDINNEVFSFPHPITSEPVWVFADFCHAVKLLRNHFIDHEIKLGEDFDNEIISKKMIEELLSIQKDDLQVTHKVTKEHLEMNKRERMNVGTAMQLFSTSVAKALLFLLPQYKKAAEFFQLVNDFSDLMNTHTSLEHSNPAKCPFGLKLEQQMEILNKFEKNIAELRVLGPRRPATKPFQKGFKLTCGSLKGLYQQMKNSRASCTYIITSHLNQDFVESQFGTFRGIGGFNDLPLPTDAIHRVKTMVVAWNLKEPTTGNVKIQGPSHSISSKRLSLMYDSEDIRVEHEPEIGEMFAHIDPQRPVPIQMSTCTDKTKLCGSEYIAGFISKKLMMEFPEFRLWCGTNQVGWVNFLSEGHLISPSRWWLATLLKFDQYFEAFHKNMYRSELNLNRSPFVIDRLVHYLEKTFPAIPSKAIRLFVRLRTKIRINAVNKKILVIRKTRRSQAFINSLIVAENPEADAVPESDDIAPETNDFEQMDMIQEPTDEDIFGEQSQDVNRLLEDEFKVIFEDELQYDPMDFDIFDEYEISEALN